ncbi:hypothetical protein Tsubulata_018943 [Turnera subulata]|uniref:Uncharacterized protein n=1 Tax=Turnera subulata TaxID=218843 RepID=A0A9Q0FJ58_9ROSI|nr:hypothetical protein Tsubulata_018943 [Turnera subulata]
MTSFSISNKISALWLRKLKGNEDIFPLLPSLVPVIILVGLFLMILAFKESKEKAPLPPGPRGLPIIGYLPFLGHNLHQLFMELAQSYGPIYKLSIGQKLCIIISSPSLAKEVVRDQDIIFANRNPTIAASAFSYSGKDIAFQPYGPEWRLLRKIFVKQMQSNTHLDAFYPLRRNEVRKSVGFVCTKIGNPVNIGELAFTTVINMISGMFWGGTLEGDAGINVGVKFREAATELVEILGRPNVSDFFPFLARFDIQGIEKEMKKASGKIEKIYDFVIDEWIRKDKAGREEDEQNQKKDFLNFLLEFKDGDTGKSISRTQIKALLMDIVVGGTDTTSTTMEWALSEMMLHSEVMKIAQEELTEVVGANNIVEECHIYRLPYLQAIVKEAMRLHPVAPLLLPRSPSQPSNVGGYTIPKGAKVFLNAWAMHRDPEFWENPSEFQPTRFLGDANNKLDYYGKHLHYIPFGSGRRICAGLQLGERMLMYVLATFLHMFIWELPNGAKVDTLEKLGAVLEKSTPLVVVPSPRLSQPDLYL